MSTQSLKGLGGLPSGSSGTAGIIVEEFFDAKRLNTCIKMILSRGSFYKLIKSDDEINDVSYLVIEPTNYNDKDIYNKQEYLEKKFNKPVLTITNLIEQDNLEDMEINFLNKIPINNYNISGDVPIKPFNNILMMLSGGIDSPVASYLLLKAGYNVDFIHFTADIDKTENIKELRNLLSKNSKLYTVSFKPVQDAIVNKCDESYRTILYKIFMIKITNKINSNYYHGIGTGNALGQVASQTIENITHSNLQSEKPVISPLFGYNKEQIIEIARKIGSYEISIKDGTNDCCTMYMPKHPVTNSTQGRINKNIAQINLELLDELEIIED